MSAKEFILIDDDNNYGEEEITDEEIVNIIKSNKTDLVEEVINLQPKISTSEALESLDKVLSFLSNPPDNFVIEFNNRNLMHNFKKQIILFDKIVKFNQCELMSAKEFILIDDDNNYGEEEITDEEIVNIIKSNKTDLVEEVINLQPKISTSEALESLDKVLSFLSNPPDNFVIEFNNRNLMHNFKKQIILFDKIVKFNQC
ncbi:hypothetical protein RclHR1_00520037 [Rhizophagus clarus]|uniref:Uncharacterized protein n=1 Tax=Rhizophagus clarus TaxID=94130 RepID=A0A2Z6RYT5_9GLOM|nr:hypothetical protein RclHR1_00520037 [Rhizophagus clarus]